MRRTIGILLGLTFVATSLGSCVDPYYGGRHHGSYDHSYGDGSSRPPQHHHDDDRGDYKLPTIVCASKDGRANRCRTDFDIQRAEVDKRYSGSPCEYGRSWGYDRNEVWVDRGCRARFVLTPAGRWR